MTAAIVAETAARPGCSAAARAVLFLPQIVPLAGAAIAWSWMYSTDGAVNQGLRLVGLGGLARPWLADFHTALPAVGLIGTWVATGLCTLLFTRRHAADRPGPARGRRAGRRRPDFAGSSPSPCRHCGARSSSPATMLTIAALASFDIVYVATAGGPGYRPRCPGVLIFRLVFTEQAVGPASALAVVLVALVLC